MIHLFLILLICINGYPPSSEIQNEYLPDLKFDNISFEYVRYPKPQPNPDVPRRPLSRDPLGIIFKFSIHNRGTLDWDNDLYIKCLFGETYSYLREQIIIEDAFIPFASKESFELEIKLLSRPSFVTFHLNTTRSDSIEQYRIFDEMYYINNSYKVELK